MHIDAFKNDVYKVIRNYKITFFESKSNMLQNYQGPVQSLSDMRVW